jgi:phosphate-selective porin
MREGEHQRAFLWVLLLFCWLAPASLLAQDASQNGNGQQEPKRFEWSSYFQLRYTGIEDAPDWYALRRFKVILRGHPKPHVEYFVQGIFKDGDHSSTDGRAYLQEAWIKFTGWKYGHLTVGQLKPPFSLERLTADYQIDTVDRAQVTDHLVPDGQLGGSFARDRGAQLDAWLASQRLYYAAGIFDGNGANNPWRGNSPLVVGRIEGVLHRSPAKSSRKDRVALGGAFSTRRDHAQNFADQLPGTAALGYTRFAGRDTHFNLEAAADFSPLSFRSEYFYAWYIPNQAALVEVRASGFYVQGAYSFCRRYQAVAKYETFDAHRAVVDAHDLRWTTVGLNWRIHGDRLRLGADYVIKREIRRQVPNNALLVQFQLFLH